VAKKSDEQNIEAQPANKSVQRSKVKVQGFEFKPETLNTKR
jgi:hypothetical protein